MEKDLFMGPTAVVAVTHSSLYWPVEGQEEDLGTMARSCWEERTKEEATERRAASAVRRICRCMLLACLLACLLIIPVLRVAICQMRRYSSIQKGKPKTKVQEIIDHQGAFLITKIFCDKLQYNNKSIVTASPHNVEHAKTKAQ